jgi:hypothetical protein
MSHDRGCACGRERSEYDSCVESNCFKRESKMDSDDWLSAHGLAEPGTKAYGEKTARTMIKQETQRYVWIRANGDATIVNDPVELWQDPCFSKTEDRIYRLGEEVEVKVSVEVKNKKPVLRENASGYRTPFENRD